MRAVMPEHAIVLYTNRSFPIATHFSYLFWTPLVL